jgi:hypothetical protein
MKNQRKMLKEAIQFIESISRIDQIGEIKFEYLEISIKWDHWIDDIGQEILKIELFDLKNNSRITYRAVEIERIETVWNEIIDIYFASEQ